MDACILGSLADSAEMMLVRGFQDALANERVAIPASDGFLFCLWRIRKSQIRGKNQCSR